MTRSATPLVAYVMTHYPRVALTFITNEIDALEALGAEIRPMAMNLPGPADLLTDDAKERRDKTLYLKQSWPLAAFSLAKRGVRHPIGVSRLIGLALMSAGLDIGLAARRIAHLLQASIVADRCARDCIRHIHAQFGLGPATVAWFAASLLNLSSRPGAAWSFTIHGFQDFIDEKVARLDLKARSAAFVVCISDFTRSQFWRVAHPDDWHKAKVIRCGIDLDAFAPRPDEPDGVPVILTVGRLSPEKGQIVLLDACALLARRGTNFRLQLVGDGPFRNALEAMTASLGIADKVDFAGECPPEEVRRALTSATLFCLPSFSEGLPISIMEAMASGVPVVASHISGIPELVVNEVNGLTVPPADPEALAAALERLLADASLRRRFSESGRKAVEADHDLAKTAPQMLELFDRTQSQPSPQSA